MHGGFDLCIQNIFYLLLLLLLLIIVIVIIIIITITTNNMPSLRFMPNVEIPD